MHLQLFLLVPFTFPDFRCSVPTFFETCCCHQIQNEFLWVYEICKSSHSVFSNNLLTHTAFTQTWMVHNTTFTLSVCMMTILTLLQSSPSNTVRSQSTSLVNIYYRLPVHQPPLPCSRFSPST